MLRSFKVELDPNQTKIALLWKFAGVARYAYNWYVTERERIVKEEHRYPTMKELNSNFKAHRGAPGNAWFKEVASRCYRYAQVDFDFALRNHFTYLKKKKKGIKPRKVGLPKLKHKYAHDAFTIDNPLIHQNSIRIEGSSIWVPRLGWVRLKEIGYIPTDIHINRITVSRRAHKWFASVLLDVPEPEVPTKDSVHPNVGIDLGINTLAVVSDGQEFQYPGEYFKLHRKLKKLSRSLSRKKKGSNNRRKAAQRLARLHYRITCFKQDVLHKMTTTLSRTKKRIVIEDLTVSNMLKNPKLAPAIFKQGWGEIRRQLTYKCGWYGTELVIASRWFPSSKLCHGCGKPFDELTLDHREWTCPHCGLHHDRDENAGINLEYYPKYWNEDVAQSHSETKNACGEKSSGICASKYETGLVEARTSAMRMVIR